VGGSLGAWASGAGAQPEATQGGHAAQSAPRQVRLARPHFRVEAPGWYPLLLLEAALAASGTGWAAQPADRMTDARALIELTAPDALVDVVLGMPNAERVQRLRLVPVPLYLGLFGWRVLVVRKGQAQRWRGLRSLQDLRALQLLQGSDWPDTEILRGNGLQVITASRVPDLYERLARGEADAFPRGITEAWGEVNGQVQGFEVVPDLALHYRSDLCFFVRRDDAPLADALTRGLHALHRSRDLHRALLAQHGKDLRQSELPRRRVIELANPSLPAAVRDLPAAWWTPPRHA
jgi:hypothetical protein